MMVKRIITILSTIILVGGIAVIGAAGLTAHESAIEQGMEYLPEAQKDWQARSSEYSAITKKIKAGEFLGTIEIPSIKRIANIFEGTTEAELSKGVGHFIQSVMPGVKDNSVISGHRDTVFSNLGKVKIGAKIVVIVESGRHVYQVERIRIVSKDNRTVIVPTEEAMLTLSTCYPFAFIGNAPERYIVVAKLLGSSRKSLL
jgi:sortase A